MQQPQQPQVRAPGAIHLRDANYGYGYNATLGHCTFPEADADVAPELLHANCALPKQLSSVVLPNGTVRATYVTQALFMKPGQVVALLLGIVA